ncbi:hypothetical protein B0H63DRAFT_508963 [Podospora didyma]|uniref:Shugoshin n=1 Tax=Podospora didyma TaxID=330526 RepID=A0AAE0U1H2_9PEZI|nr:hypothetical protein B0H63DRAFT_508963 [Podospora didyma]
MARLNELPASTTDNFEILRRKFLRQNRDIARINSNQSLRIRALENECARLLSENLDLRGQILRLEKEAENNSSQRIADHALEIKARLEAQLADWGSMLATLGVEPPSKRRSPKGRRFARPRENASRSPTQRRIRLDTITDAEALALREGRLPPIQENKSYPRATMNSEEIMALCSEAADSSNSPDLGPPPVSRFVEDEPSKPESPSNKTGIQWLQSEAEEISKASENRPIPRLDYGQKAASNTEAKQETQAVVVKETKPETEATPIPKPPPLISTVKAGAKRKFGDENDRPKAAVVPAGKENEISAESGKALPARDLQKKRNIKDISARLEKAAGTRTPLSVKSTNEDISSPRKVASKAQAQIPDASKPATSTRGHHDPKNALATEGRIKAEKSLPRIDVQISATADTGPLPETTDIVISEPNTPLPAEPPLISPATPGSRSGPVHDTPPPADISLTGEISRPSRRARAAISYAEPNLRDKMRRPTKELFDAVAGEGKFSHRASTSAAPVPASTGKVPGSADSSHPLTSAGELHRDSIMMSPLAQKDRSPETLPNSVVLERRKRPSVTDSSNRESLAPAPDGPGDLSSSHPARSKNSGPARAEKHNTDISSVPDIYDFGSSSIISEPPADDAESTTKAANTSTTTTTNARSSSSSRNGRRVSTATRDDKTSSSSSSSVTTEVMPPTTKSKLSSSTNSRKRASMLPPRKTPMILDDDGDAEDESAADTSSEIISKESSSARDRVSRRRSMLL